MFPITDLRGRIIAFGGRALEKDAQAKYLNSPETPLFHKGANLYNFAAARKAAHDGAPLIVVEGYVDVIAMVTAGFGATVAPLGTALTEDQLSLLWKLTDEPMLCFDGDKAGLRAAYRAVELAVPRLKPGKSLKFALLPEGQDPDDLVRAAGRSAVEEVIAASRPLAAMLWARETEGHSLDTPERRAALEARLKQVVDAIGDEAVRKYYRQDFSERLAQLFGLSTPSRGGYDRGQGYGEGWRRQGAPQRRGGADQRRREKFGGDRFAGPPLIDPNRPYVAVSQQMAASPLSRGGRTAIPRREALILLAALNHPWLLHDHLEELVALEFRHPDADRLKSALIDLAAHEFAEAGRPEPAALAAELAKRGLSELTGRVTRAITTPGVWAAQPGAAEADVLVTWQQLVALHRQRHALIKELKDAELALGQDNSEANFLRLRDVQARLASMEGTEALIEGFGAASGRLPRGV
jgi:DNA primase